ncbi:MAG: SIMPL domain-containing protein [Rickettsiales bacterium]|jgi:uncharacterized protein YggE|nr:SIMPL domain-containing protein [Rickettsiales bacterium]
MNWNKNIVLSAVAAVVCAGILGWGIARDNNNFKTVNVTGECIRKVAKDRTSVVVEIKNLESTNTLATKKSMDTYKRVSDLVVAMKEKNPKIELETQSINSYEKFEYQGAGSERRRVSVGFESVVELKIISDNGTEISEFLGSVSQMADVYTGSLTTFTSRQLMKSEQESCIAEATENARQKAQALADGGHTRLGRMTNASFYQTAVASNTGGMVRMAKAAPMMMETAADEAGFGGPQIFSSDSDLSVTVNASFELR